MDGLAYSSQTGLFGYELSGTQSRLVRINESNGQVTTVGGFLSGDFRGAAFFGNELLVLDSATNRILTIDVSNGAIVSSAALMRGASSYNLGNSVDLAVNNGTVYVVEGGRTGSGPITTGNGVFGTNFFSLDVSTGLLTLLYQDLINEAGVNQRLVGTGVAFEPGSSLAYLSEMNSGDGIFRYNVASGFARIRLTAEVVPTTNSGRGDLASDSAPIPEPATLGLIGAGLAAFALFFRRRKV